MVELFTSQSCYSCPPEEAYLGELSGEKDILALEYHVDYWDSLNYGGHGRWKDAISTPEMAARQRDYNAEIRDTRSVYTPQMVIGGRTETVGSRRREVTTQVVRGENHDKTLTSYNIVRSTRHIGKWDGKTAAFDVSDLILEQGQSCAVLVQDGQVGPVLGAAS